MNDLRNALHDLADSAPASPLPSDLWERGRASRRTARLQLIAAVLVVIACLAASVSLLRPVVTAAPASGPETDGALPATVYAPQGALAGISSRNPDENRSERDLSAIGRVSAAVTDNPLQPVLVSAVDGTHHVVDLPDRLILELSPSAPVTVSPDGWLVAYAWAEVAEQTADTRAGVAWVDLRTGVVTQIRVRGREGRPVLVGELAWSRDSQRLAWTGDPLLQWDRSGSRSNSRTLEIGTIPVDARRTEPTTWSLGRDDGMRNTGGAAVAVDVQGPPVLLAGRRLWTFAGEQPRGQAVIDNRVPTTWSTAVLADGHLIVGRNTEEGGHENVVGTATINLNHDQPRAHFQGWGDTPTGSIVKPLGITPAGRVVASVSADTEEGRDVAHVEARDADGSTITLTRWTGQATALLTAATDLADQPVVDFPEPEWPLSTEQIVGRVVLGSGVVLLAGAVVVLIWRRRRQAHLPE